MTGIIVTATISLSFILVCVLAILSFQWRIPGARIRVLVETRDTAQFIRADRLALYNRIWQFFVLLLFSWLCGFLLILTFTLIREKLIVQWCSQSRVLALRLSPVIAQSGCRERASVSV